MRGYLVKLLLSILMILTSGNHMKRLFLMPVFFWGLSFACDQSYEEIEGIKIGCPYTGDSSLGVSKNDDEKIIVYEQRLENSLFDSVEMEVMEGNIESLSFSKTFHDLGTLQKERDILFDSLDQRWGKAVVLGDNETLIVYVNKNPNSEYLGSILVMSSFIESAGILQVTYSSEKLSN